MPIESSVKKLTFISVVKKKMSYVRFLVYTLALRVLVAGHIWYPEGFDRGRDLTTADCSSTTNPSWSSTTSSTTAKFSSYHLHVSWAVTSHLFVSFMMCVIIGLYLFGHLGW